MGRGWPPHWRPRATGGRACIGIRSGLEHVQPHGISGLPGGTAEHIPFLTHPPELLQLAGARVIFLTTRHIFSHGRRSKRKSPDGDVFYHRLG